MGESRGSRGSGGLPLEILLGPRPLERRKNASFQNRIWLVLVIETYTENENLIPQAGFIEFCRLKTGKKKAPQTSHFEC